MIVGFERVRLDVPVNERLRVIGGGLVQVFLRQRRAQGKPGRQGEGNDDVAQPGGHALIMHAIALSRRPRDQRMVIVPFSEAFSD